MSDERVGDDGQHREEVVHGLQQHNAKVVVDILNSIGRAVSASDAHNSGVDGLEVNLVSEKEEVRQSRCKGEDKQGKRAGAQERLLPAGLLVPLIPTTVCF